MLNAAEVQGRCKRTCGQQHRSAQGPKAVLGPGTGLGQAQVLWDEGLGGYRVWPSEGSHATFAPRGWKQRALQVQACCLVQGAQRSAVRRP